LPVLENTLWRLKTIFISGDIEINILYLFEMLNFCNKIFFEMSGHYSEVQLKLSRYAKALNHPVRIQILQIL